LNLTKEKKRLGGYFQVDLSQKEGVDNDDWLLAWRKYKHDAEKFWQSTHVRII
jgi:hypothetical protein